MKRWIGRWMIGTSILHTLFAAFVFWETWIQIWQYGVLDTVKENVAIAAPVFFLLWGLIYFVFGTTVDFFEKKQNKSLPLTLGWGLFINGLIAVVLIPESGFWLLFPPAIAIILEKFRKSR